MINPRVLAEARRKNAFKKEDDELSLLLTNFTDSEQEKDLQKTKGTIQGAIDDFYRVKTNIKPAAWAEYQKTGNKRSLMFDFNWWPISALGGSEEKRNAERWNDVFIYQLKACNLACPFCFVDRSNNNGRLDHQAEYISVTKIVDAFIRKREEMLQKGQELNVLRGSGGEPSLVPEQWLAILQELDKRGLSEEVFFQSDTNLTTRYLIDRWITEGKLNAGILSEIAQYPNFGLLGCFKGTDPQNFAENTGCKKGFFEEQFRSYRRFQDLGVPIYPHLINPNPDTLELFMERLARELGEEILPMMHLLTIGIYGPVAGRLTQQGRNVQEVADQWKDNYRRGEEILENLLQQKRGVGYKELSRPELMQERLKRL